MPQTYHKLIRDHIPDIIAAEGRQYAIEELDDAAYLPALAAKLVEEAQEAEAALRAGDQQEILKELADLAEVLDAVLAHQGISPEAGRACQQERRASRGGFDRRLHLLWVT
jgi:predicted house-cleaning noncanonical NTP pyrophosphatase (MazG superfamily)